MSIDVADLCRESHEYATSRGFWTRPEPGSTRAERQYAAYSLALIAGEAHEAIDALRKEENWHLAVGQELADVVLRVTDFCEGYGIDLERHIRSVQARSRMRPAMHGKHA